MVRIVLVDTDDLLLKLKTALFSREGFLLLTAKTGEDVLRLAATNSPDLIFINLDLPDMSGVDCCESLKKDERSRRIPVVISAPPDREGDIERAVEVGCDVVIPRPVLCKEFIAATRKFIKLEERGQYRMPTRFPVLHGMESDPLLAGYALNLSTDGMFLETDATVPPGTVIELKFFLPEGESKICCTARVAWLNNGELSRQNLPPGMGVQFLDLEADARRLITGFISTMLKQSRLEIGSFNTLQWVA
jgi:two-component system, OmpR family, alkaline phosphatase synthesis response regulator PhoP